MGPEAAISDALLMTIPGAEPVEVPLIVMPGEPALIVTPLNSMAPASSTAEPVAEKAAPAVTVREPLRAKPSPVPTAVPCRVTAPVDVMEPPDMANPSLSPVPPRAVPVSATDVVVLLPIFEPLLMVNPLPPVVPPIPVTEMVELLANRSVLSRIRPPSPGEVPERVMAPELIVIDESVISSPSPAPAPVPETEKFPAD